ncbi:MAG: hypothetical protein EON49_12020 [Acidovorax sp.]|nr:MAG: hypothetical protein EON49_12020 [Acidovorax sp.]
MYFASLAQAAVWAAEAQASANLPLPEQARALGTLLGLGEDAGVSFEWAGAAQLCAEVAVWPPMTGRRGSWSGAQSS